AAARRFESRNSTAAGGNTDRSAAVGALRPGDEARADGCRRSAAGATGISTRIPWSKGRTDQVIIGVRRESELGGIGFAQADEPGTLDQPCHMGRYIW